MLRHLVRALPLPATLGLALALGGCAQSRGRIDAGLAARAEALTISESNGEKGSELTFGEFVLHDVGFGDLSRVEKDGNVEARDRFTYALRDASGREWTGACQMALSGRATSSEMAVDRKNDRETLSCELGRTPASADGGWRMQLHSGGGEHGRKYGEVKQKRTLLEILSSHTGRTPSGALGPAVGYELSYDDRVVAALDTSEGEKVVWIEKNLDLDARGLVGAAAATLIVYESMVSR